MLDSLTTEVWSYMIVGLVVAGVCYAWAADAILGYIGFGVIVTSILAIAGGYGGLLCVDWAVIHQKIPFTYATPLTYIGGSISIVTVLLIVLCLFKRLVAR